MVLAAWSAARGLTAFLIIPGIVIGVPLGYWWYCRLRKVWGRH